MIPTEKDLRDNFAESTRAALIDLLFVTIHASRQSENLTLCLKNVLDRIKEEDTGLSNLLITDTRIVSAIEKMQRLLKDDGVSTIEGEEWQSLSCVLARLQLSFSIETGFKGYSWLNFAYDSDMCLPGTNICVSLLNRDGPNEVEVSISDGELSGQGIATSNAGVQLGDEYQIAVPEYCLVPPIEKIRLLKRSEYNLSHWSEQTAAALRLVELHPPSKRLVRSFSRGIIPIHNEIENTECSVSFDSLPGMIFTSYGRTPQFLAETLVHESDHQRHYMLTRNFDIWKDEAPKELAEFRSPWRVDARPADGILRGASAFVSVGEFWLFIQSRQRQLTPEVISWARRRAFLTNFQAVDALTTLTHVAGLTEQGEELLHEMSMRARLVKNELLSIENCGKYLESAYQQQTIHDEEWERFNVNLSDRRHSLTVVGYGSF